MAGIVSSVQRDYDYDFMGFTYNGVHSIRDLNVYRVSNGSRYDFALAPTITDSSMDIPGNDGMYFFNTFHKQRQFTINIAFNELTESGLRRLRQLFNGKTVGELIFDETPYKAYAAKITGTPTIKAICFDERRTADEETLQRVYRGEGTLQFTCYLPYAYTPNWVWTREDSDFSKLIDIDGRYFNNYNNDAYQTKNEWAFSSGLFGTAEQVGEERAVPSSAASYVVNYGDVPAPFVAKKNGRVDSGTILKVGEVEIKVLEDCENLVWDSRTGMVSATEGETSRPINYSGVSCGTIPTGGIEVSLSNLTFSQVEYKFWYY